MQQIQMFYSLSEQNDRQATLNALPAVQATEEFAKTHLMPLDLPYAGQAGQSSLSLEL